MVIGEVPVVVVSRGEAQGPINMFVYNETNVHMEKLWQCDIKMMPYGAVGYKSNLQSVCTTYWINAEMESAVVQATDE